MNFRSSLVMTSRMNSCKNIFQLWTPETLPGTVFQNYFSAEVLEKISKELLMELIKELLKKFRDNFWRNTLINRCRNSRANSCNTLQTSSSSNSRMKDFTEELLKEFWMKFSEKLHDKLLGHYRSIFHRNSCKFLLHCFSFSKSTFWWNFWKDFA